MKTVFFDVDTQIDFLFPAGALYVPGAEHIIPNIARLNRYAAENGIPLVSTVDAHTENDPEFAAWPPHCIVGTVGQQKPASTLVGQIFLEKQDGRMGEFDYIRWLRQRVAANPRVEVGIGDDCAVVDLPTTKCLITTDMLLDGTHFRLAECGPRRVGRKVLAVNLSDIAAMGGRPTAAVVSLGLPRQGTGRIAEELFLGMEPLAQQFQVAIVGGDTNSWDGPLAVSITLLGEPGPCGPILRSGAKPGDWLLVTGPLGGSIRGKHFDFTPRVAEALELQKHCRPRAMIDVSDGLAADVGHLCEESGVGCVIVAERVPLGWADGPRGGLDHALADGEDFELAFAVGPEEGRRLIATQPVPGITLTWIGEFTVALGLVLEQNGARGPIAATGYKHRFG